MGPHSHLSDRELLRYKRQIAIPSIGEEGQRKIKETSVFVAGAGGLGSISSYYLAAAGIGQLTIVDKDKVEMSNLNRQIIHDTSDLGKPKVLSAKKKLEALNPHCAVRPFYAEMNKENIIDLIGDCSIIVDATDSIETRKVLNYASLQKKAPFIYGGVDGFQGMITTFVPGESPCFECLFANIQTLPKAPAVIGPLPGVIGSLQALEAIKIILNLGGLLMGRLLFLSAVDMTFREIKVERNLECPACT